MELLQYFLQTLTTCRPRDILATEAETKLIHTYIYIFTNKVLQSAQHSQNSQATL